jgi:DNA-binding MarR family transcriptional regulator
MIKGNQSIRFFIDLAKTQSILSNRFDRGLGGLGFSEFLILYHLNQSTDQKMRRVDIADKIGMTASGVTRLLLPMEKVGYVKSGEAEADARVRNVIIASGGKQRLKEALARLDDLIEDIMPPIKQKSLDDFSEFIMTLGGKALMN